MNKRQKTSKKRDQAKKMCFYMDGFGFGYSDRGLANFGGFDECGHYHDVCCC